MKNSFSRKAKDMKDKAWMVTPILMAVLTTTGRYTKSESGEMIDMLDDRIDAAIEITERLIKRIEPKENPE